jgi:hypothetical protein
MSGSPLLLITDADAETLSVLPRKFRDCTVLAVALLLENSTDFAAIDRFCRKCGSPMLIAARNIETLTENCLRVLHLLPDNTQVYVVSENPALASLLYALHENAPVTLYYTQTSPAVEPLFLAADHHKRFSLIFTRKEVNFYGRL